MKLKKLESSQPTTSLDYQEALDNNAIVSHLIAVTYILHTAH